MACGAAPDRQSSIPGKGQQTHRFSLHPWQCMGPGSTLFHLSDGADQYHDFVNGVNGNYTATDSVLFQSSSLLREPDTSRAVWEQCAHVLAPLTPPTHKRLLEVQGLGICPSCWGMFWSLAQHGSPHMGSSPAQTWCEDYTDRGICFHSCKVCG